MRVVLILLLACLQPQSAASASELLPETEYNRGWREAAAFGEMLGIIEGVIYGHSLVLEAENPGAICLLGSPKDRVRKIAEAIGSEAFSKDPVLMNDVPTKDEAREFLRRFFSCALGKS